MTSLANVLCLSSYATLISLINIYNLDNKGPTTDACKISVLFFTKGKKQQKLTNHEEIF